MFQIRGSRLNRGGGDCSTVGEEDGDEVRSMLMSPTTVTTVQAQSSGLQRPAPQAAAPPTVSA